MKQVFGAHKLSGLLSSLCGFRCPWLIKETRDSFTHWLKCISAVDAQPLNMFSENLHLMCNAMAIPGNNSSEREREKLIIILKFTSVSVLKYLNQQ